MHIPFPCRPRLPLPAARRLLAELLGILFCLDMPVIFRHRQGQVAQIKYSFEGNQPYAAPDCNH
jgi:hypothetical protein